MGRCGAGLIPESAGCVDDIAKFQEQLLLWKKHWQWNEKINIIENLFENLEFIQIQILLFISFLNFQHKFINQVLCLFPSFLMCS